jgi:hypothetical protein
MLIPFLKTFHRTIRLGLRSEVSTCVRRSVSTDAVAGVTFMKAPQVLFVAGSCRGGVRGVAIAGNQRHPSRSCSRRAGPAFVAPCAVRSELSVVAVTYVAHSRSDKGQCSQVCEGAQA